MCPIPRPHAPSHEYVGPEERERDKVTTLTNIAFIHICTLIMKRERELIL
jgi:hypothetical protein